ncbi:MAG TPA: hypothetical protein VGC84_10355, partial [Ilumatobacteraceae bacterium]
ARHEEMSAEDVDAMIGDIIAGRITFDERSRLHVTPRRWVTVGIALTVAAGGATAAAAMWNSRPDRLEAGIACHTSTDTDATAVAIRPSAADPIAACGELWTSGALPNVVGGGARIATPPPLIECIGAGGGLDIYPILSDAAVSCGDLGLRAAVAEPVGDPLVALENRLTDDINVKCVDLPAAQRLAATAVADLRLDGWTVDVEEHPRECIKAGEDATTRSIYLFTLPNQPQP